MKTKVILNGVGIAHLLPLYFFLVRYVLWSVETVPFERIMCAIFLAVVGLGFFMCNAD